MKPSNAAFSFAIPRELGRVSVAWVRHGILGFPYTVGRSFLSDPSFEGVFSEERFCDFVGEVTADLFDDLGPIYGKAGQIALSRLTPRWQKTASRLRLTRLYKDWPPMPLESVTGFLDQELPGWREEFTLEAQPLGVASLAQVHAATDKAGREWVIKIIKPHAKTRLLESVAAIEQLVALGEPLAVTHVARRFLKETSELCLGFRQELSLAREKETIERVTEKIGGKRQRTLIIPEVNAPFCTDNVLVVERFRGTALSDVVQGKVEIPPVLRQKLAKSMLSELLVQVFELGLFHADPHAGNLILMETGEVGLFDWGLSGELLESDRRHIAAILKAVLALDLERLIDALVQMGQDGGQKVGREEIRKELKTVVALIKAGREDPAKKPSIHALFEACLKSASRLGIPIPEGLLMMAKSLITIEGLARGLDPKVSLGRIATPVLFRAARPGFADVVAIGRKLPTLAKQMLHR